MGTDFIVVAILEEIYIVFTVASVLLARLVVWQFKYQTILSHSASQVLVSSSNLLPLLVNYSTLS